MKFTIEKNGADVGEISIYKRGTGWILTNFYVEPCMRGKGYGTQLIKKALKWVDAYGIKLTIRVAPYGKGPRLSVEGLASFYQRYGFITVGERMIRPAKEKRLRGVENRV